MDKVHIFITTTTTGEDKVRIVFAADRSTAEKEIIEPTIKRYDGFLPLKMFVDRLNEAKKHSDIDNKKGKHIELPEYSEPKFDLASMIPKTEEPPVATKSTNSQLACFARLLIDKATATEEERKVLTEITNRLETASNTTN